MAGNVQSVSPTARTASGFPVAFVMIPSGLLLCAVGFAIVAVTRVAPNLPAFMPGLLTRSALPAVVLGSILLYGGLAAIALGWGKGSPRRPLPYGSHRSIIVATVLAVVSGVIPVVALISIPGIAPKSLAAFLVAALALDGALLGIMYIQAMRPGFVTRRMLGLERDQLLRGVLWGVAGGSVLLAISLLAGLVLQVLQLPQPQVEELNVFRGLPMQQWMLIVGAGAIASPLAEEMFFRGYIFNAYLAQKGATTAYVGSALIFGVLHGAVVLLVPIFLMGLVLAFLYRRSGTLVAPMVAHMINNGFAFAAFLLGTS